VWKRSTWQDGRARDTVGGEAVISVAGGVDGGAGGVPEAEASDLSIVSKESRIDERHVEFGNRDLRTPNLSGVAAKWLAVGGLRECGVVMVFMLRFVSMRFWISQAITPPFGGAWLIEVRSRNFLIGIWVFIIVVHDCSSSKLPQSSLAVGDVR
jgi:hypothetical protein